MEGNHVTHSNMDEPTCHLGCYTKRNKWKSLSRVQLSIQSMDFSGQNTGVDRLSVLQGIFPTQGSNLGLPPCRWILYCLSHQGSMHWDMWNNLLKAYFLGFIYWEHLYQIGYRIFNRMLSYFTSSNRLFGQVRQVEVKGQLHYSSRHKKMESCIILSGQSQHPNRKSWSGLMVSRRFHKVVLNLFC